MRVIYNGIDLGVLDTHYCHFEPVYDDTGVDYLYTRVTLAVRAVVNGQVEVTVPNPNRGFNGPFISYALGDVLPPPKTGTADLRSVGTGIPLRDTPRGGVPGGAELRAGAGPGVRFLPGAVGTVLAGAVGGLIPGEGTDDVVARAAGGIAGGAATPDALTIGAAVVAGAVATGPGKIIIGDLVPKKRPPLGRPRGRIETVRTTVDPDCERPPPDFIKGTDGTIPDRAGVAAADPSKLRQVLRVPNDPLLSLAAVRHRLTTPRGKLYLFSGLGQESGAPLPGTPDPPANATVVTVESPQPGAPTDCKNGPSPRGFSVVQAMGDGNTLVVDWAVETYIVEAAENGVGCSGYLVSNRFGQTHDVTEDGYTAITTEGTALFRTDRVFQGPVTPDAIRSRLFLPVPQGFVRAGIRVQGLSDATGVRYQFSDYQVPVNFTAGPYARAAKISAVHSQAITVNADLFGAVARTLNTTVQTALNLKWLRDAGKGDTHPEIPKWLLNLIHKHK